MDGSIVHQHLVEHRGPIVLMDKRPGPVMNMEDLSKALQEAIIHIDIIHVDPSSTSLSNEKELILATTLRLKRRNKPSLCDFVPSHRISDNLDAANEKKKKRVVTQEKQGKEKGSKRCKFLEGVCIESTAMTAFKKDDVKQEVEPNEDMIRSALRAISSLAQECKKKHPRGDNIEVEECYFLSSKYEVKHYSEKLRSMDLYKAPKEPSDMIDLNPPPGPNYVGDTWVSLIQSTPFMT
ncbi:hypothetical protein Tco_0995229 [Tanacetum coccineum]